MRATDYDLAVLSDLVIDILLPVERLPIEAGRFQFTPGMQDELGGGCNFLIAARRLGLRTASLGGIGQDERGRVLKELLAEEGIDTSHIQIFPDRPTEYCFVVIDEIGQHVYLGIRHDRQKWHIHPDWPGVIARSQALLCDGYIFRDLIYTEDIFEAMQAAHGAGNTVYFDPGPSVEQLTRDTVQTAIGLADTLFITEEEAQVLSFTGTPEEIAAALREGGPQQVVVKIGAAGCVVAHAAGIDRFPGFPVAAVDTVGAGDSFAVAYIAAVLRGGSVRDCATLANAMGAVVASAQGAGRQIASATRLLELLGGDPAARLVHPPSEPV